MPSDGQTIFLFVEFKKHFFSKLQLQPGDTMPVALTHSASQCTEAELQ